MKPTDEQLDQWLRDVTPPADLKSQLVDLCSTSSDCRKEPLVPRRPERRSSVRRGQRRLEWWLTIGLATAIATFSMFLVFPSPFNRIVDLRPNGSLPEYPDVPSFETELAEMAQAMLDDLRQNQSELELLSRQLLLTRSQTELARLTASLPPAQVPERDFRSLVEFSASQARLEWGGDPSLVRADLKQILSRYPDSEGAARAAEWLNE